MKAAITSYKITEFTSACENVASSVVHLYTSVVNPGCEDDGKPLVPLKQVAFWKFDKQGAVLKYDAWIPNLNEFTAGTLPAPVSDVQYQAQSIQQICAVTQQRCQGPNQQWKNVEECVSTLSQRPYGTYDAAWGDNVVCRSIHVILTQVRPDVSFPPSAPKECAKLTLDQVHCAHVGPTGGEKCVDGDFTQRYFDDESLYGEPTGQTFMCPR